MTEAELIKQLEYRACGGHPDGVRQDSLSREAVDKIVLLRAEVIALRGKLDRIRAEARNAALEELLAVLMAKRAQLVEYRDGIVTTDGPVQQHAFTVAEGRISQIDQDIAAIRALKTEV